MPVSVFQIWTVLSHDAEAMRVLSGDHARDQITGEWLCKLEMSLPVWVFSIRIVPSSPPQARYFPFGDQATAYKSA